MLEKKSNRTAMILDLDCSSFRTASLEIYEIEGLCRLGWARDESMARGEEEVSRFKAALKVSGRRY